MLRIRALSGEPALRCPKCAAAKRPTKPSISKPDIALSQKPRHVCGVQPRTSRHCQAIVPSSVKVRSGAQWRRPVQPAKAERW